MRIIKKKKKATIRRIIKIKKNKKPSNYDKNVVHGA